MGHADTVVAEALIVHNAAANAKAALPTILGVDTLVNFTEILVVKHTDCGGLSIGDAHMKDGKCQPDRKEGLEHRSRSRQVRSLRMESIA